MEHLYYLTLQTQAAPPVSLADAKAQLRIDNSDHDDYLTALILRATSLIEAETNRDLRASTWVWTGRVPDLCMFGIPYPYSAYAIPDTQHYYRQAVYMPRFPLASVTSIQYYDVSNTLQTWDSSNYYVMTPDKALGWIQPQFYWPIQYPFRPDAVQITFTTAQKPLNWQYCAVGDWATLNDSENTTVVPEEAKAAILLCVGTWLENRESETEARLQSLDPGFDRILNGLRANEVM